jgi:ATP-dependent helicase/DNAse subunit B
MQILGQLESASSSANVSNDRAVAKALQTKVKQALRVSGTYRKGGGVFVGELNVSPLLCFDSLIVIGSSEGALPKRQLESPLISNEVCDILDELYPGMFPSTVELSRLEKVAAHSIFTSADQITFSFARSGLVGSGSGHLSPLLEKIPSLSIKSVSHFSEYTDAEANAVLPFDLARKTVLQGAAGSNTDRESQPGLDSAVALYSHEYGHFSGNFKVDVSSYLTDKVLSPSAIETYLKCPHKFFVTKILGFVFEDDDDEIEVFRASDFGTIVHSSFEQFHKLCLADNLLPNFGEAFTADAIEQFSLIFNQECDRAIAKGQAGWLPLFEQKRKTFLKNLNLYFALEHKHRSMSPGGQVLLRDAFTLRPHLAEYSFDLDGLMPVRIPVEGTKKTHDIQFKGRIDRADKSRSDYMAGIVDFKTSRAISITSSAEEHIQDLVYSYALRHNSADFSNTKIVVFSYLTINKEKESKLVNLRENYPDGQPVDAAIFKSESEGGYSDTELPSKVQEHNAKLDGLLIAHLRSLIVAGETGNFPLNPESKSVNYCEVCSDSFGKANAKIIYSNAKNGK